MKLPIIEIIIICMCIVDLLATYNYVNTFNKKFPKLDYKTLEANPILRNSWNLWGLKLGTIIGGTIILGLVVILAFTLTINFKYYFMGVFSMMLIYHLLNWIQLTNLK
jgi:hypothetical protein